MREKVSQKFLEDVFFRSFGAEPITHEHWFLPTLSARSGTWYALTIAIIQQSAQAHNLYKYTSLICTRDVCLGSE